MQASSVAVTTRARGGEAWSLRSVRYHHHDDVRKGRGEVQPAAEPVRPPGSVESPVEKLKQLPLTKPLEYTFTGMILASFNGGYIYECISIFESMKDHCTPNIGTVNVMLKVYGCCDMYGKAKDLFETTKACFSSSQTYVYEHSSLKADAHTYSSMLEASASAQQWEYFEYVYREMVLSHHHLDQKKYSWLLIKASRAGKSNLLEHALNSILERGDIPDVQLITESICLSIAHSDYGRTLQLLNIMTEASITMNELEWVNLLHQSTHQFSIDTLQDLMKHLSTGCAINADPALGLVRALQSQYGAALVKGKYLLTDDASTQHCELPLLKNGDKFSSSNLAEQDQLPRKSLRTVLLDVPDSRRYVPQLGAGDVMSRDVSIHPQLESKHGQCDLGLQGTQVSAIDEVLDSMNSYGDSSYGEMPSASEILELWEQERLNCRFAPKMENRIAVITSLQDK